MQLIYYIIICDVILILIGLLVSIIIDRANKSVDMTIKLIHSMGEDLSVIGKDLDEMNKMLEDKSMILDGIIGKIKEKDISRRYRYEENI